MKRVHFEIKLFDVFFEQALKQNICYCFVVLVFRIIIIYIFCFGYHWILKREAYA